MTATTALLVIDMQRALCEGEEQAHDAEGLISRINGLMARADDAKVPVICIQHEEAQGSLQHGSPGWALDSRLAVPATAMRLRKTTPDSFHLTDLRAVLEELGIKHVIVCGLQSDYCVDTTVRRALALGFPVTLVADGHSTVDNSVLKAPQISAHHNAALSSMSSFGPRVTLQSAKEISFGV